MNRVIISGIGVDIPKASISNEELVASFNDWVGIENARRAARGEELLQKSNSDFIVYASGVKNRHVIEREGILDPSRMAPRIPARPDDALSVEAEFGVASAKHALAHAGREAADIDMVICAASHHQRPYPAIAIEIQNALGAKGAGFDMGLGCSSAAAGLHVAFNLVRTGAQKRVLVVTPEIITGHLNFRDRQTHFIFGDASTSMIVEAIEDGETRPGRFEILDTRSWTQFSNNIRTNLGYLTRTAADDPYMISMEGNMIKQVGNKVFKEVTVAGHRFIVEFPGRAWPDARRHSPVLAASGQCPHERDDPEAGLRPGRWPRSRADGAGTAGQYGSRRRDRRAQREPRRHEAWRLWPPLRIWRRLLDRRRPVPDDVGVSNGDWSQ